MKFKVGDKVRIKSVEDIIKTLDNGDSCGDMFYCEDGMSRYSGGVYDIVSADEDGDYDLNVGGVMDWYWIDEWLDPVVTKVPYNLDEGLFEL